jgi:NAD(P)-dependent dehydrogenase (short-subunit alcohol dehydrogenase family)
VTGRTQTAVSEAVAKIEAGVPAARTIAMAVDLSHAAGCAHLIERVPRADILVNNVGIYEPKPFFEIADEDWQRMFEVNVMSGCV